MTSLAGYWDRLSSWLLDDYRGSYGMAVMRIGFGAITIALVAMFLPDMSYSFGEGSRWGEAFYRTSMADEYAWPISALFSRSDSDTATLIKVLVLLLLAIAYTLGWRMRVVSPLFVVVLLGFASTNPLLFATGHHQTLRVMLIFLLLADTSRVWSLDARRRRKRGGAPRPGTAIVRVPGWFPILANNVAVVLVGAQLCIAYVTSAMWKLQGQMWGDGTAVYYALRLRELALFPALNDAIWPLTPLVLIATFAAVYGQLIFPVLLLNRWTRALGLVVVLGLHVAIGVLLSLPWFSLVMIVSDMVFIRTVTWRWTADLVRQRADRLSARMGGWFGRAGGQPATAGAGRDAGAPAARSADTADGERTDARNDPDRSGAVPPLSPVGGQPVSRPEATRRERRR